jgi:hypothetical protein
MEGVLSRAVLYLLPLPDSLERLTNYRMTFAEEL